MTTEAVVTTGFKAGDRVRHYTGALGEVRRFDEDGNPVVLWDDGDGEYAVPSDDVELVRDTDGARLEASVRRVSGAVRLCIADPPYPPMLAAGGRKNRASRWYGNGQRSRKDRPSDQHPLAAEWDDVARHRKLMADLMRDFDGWAIATCPDGLAAYMPLPIGARIMSWVKPNAQPGAHRILSKWEAVIVYPPEGRRSNRGGIGGVSDVLVCNAPRQGFIGAKPPAWTAWVLAALTHQPDDVVVDLFCGSGSVAKALAAAAGEGARDEARLEIETLRSVSRNTLDAANRVIGERDDARAAEDCGQVGPVCARPGRMGGCARHWYERNRELSASLTERTAERDEALGLLAKNEGRVKAIVDDALADQVRMLERERDALAAALAEVRSRAVSASSCLAEVEVGGHEGDEESGCHDKDCQACAIEAAQAAAASLNDALAALPADLAAAHDARVRAEALEDAARDVCDHEQLAEGRTLAAERTSLQRWLRARAAEKRGGR